jgi:hypothetical protein
MVSISVKLLPPFFRLAAAGRGVKISLRERFSTLARRRLSLLFYCYDDVVNDTATKELSGILSDTQKHICIEQEQPPSLPPPPPMQISRVDKKIAN